MEKGRINEVKKVRERKKEKAIRRTEEEMLYHCPETSLPQ